MAAAVSEAGVSESVRARPAGPLAGLVSYYSGYRLAGQPPGRHTGMPSPYLTVIFTLDDPLEMARHPDPGQAPAAYRTLAGGLHTGPALITHPGRQSGIQLAVSPLAARALFGLPAGELAHLDVDGTDAFGPLAAELQEQLQGAAGWPQRFALLDRALGARLAASRDVGVAGISPEVARAWQLLLARGGQVPVSALAAETGWSERHLRARLREETGLTPKAGARVIRFDLARRRLAARVRAGSPPALADLAAVSGYYDQAHLDREFRSLGGCAPTTWLAEELSKPEVQDHAGFAEA